MSKGGKGEKKDLSPGDIELVHRFKRGDRQAFTILVERYSARVYNTILRMVKDPHEAEDLAQDAFLSAYRFLGKFKEKSSFYTWIFRIAVNKTLNRLKVKKRSLAILDSSIETDRGSIQKELADDTQDPQKHLSRDELNRVIEKAISGLTPGNRIVFVLREVDGFSYNEIATMLGIKEQAVRTRVHRARRDLQQLLKGYVDRDFSE